MFGMLICGFANLALGNVFVAGLCIGTATVMLCVDIADMLAEIDD